METRERINQIMQALNLREEAINAAGFRESVPTVSGGDRASLITELVNLLINPV